LVLAAFSAVLWARGKRDEPPASAAQQSGPSLSGKKIFVADANFTHNLNFYVAYEKGLFIQTRGRKWKSNRPTPKLRW
jgi:hypothetical protein